MKAKIEGRKDSEEIAKMLSEMDFDDEDQLCRLINKSALNRLVEKRLNYLLDEGFCAYLDIEEDGTDAKIDLSFGSGMALPYYGRLSFSEMLCGLRILQSAESNEAAKAFLQNVKSLVEKAEKKIAYLENRPDSIYFKGNGVG